MNRNCNLGVLNTDVVDEDGHIFYRHNLSYLNHGVNAEVWRWQYDGKQAAVKIFFDEAYHKGMKLDVASVLKNLHLVSLPNIHSILKKKGNSSGSMDGYVMEYLEEDFHAHFLDLPVENIVSSFQFMEQDATTLASHHVLMADVFPGNMMITKSGQAHLFDSDLYQICEDCSCDEILDDNYQLLISLIRLKLQQDILHDLDVPVMDCFAMINAIDSFFSFEMCSSVPSEQIQSFFQSAKTPRQYFKKFGN